jgi:hypothetical protein
MAQVTFTSEQKAQLIGWLNREKDYLLSCNAMAGNIIITEISGSLECLRNDLDFVMRLKQALRGESLNVEIDEQDKANLILVADANRYANREALWKSVKEVLSDDDSNTT